MSLLAKTKKIASQSRPGQPDYFLIALVGAIILFGLVMLSSATSVFAYSRYDDVYFFFKKQLVSIVLGFVGFWIFAVFDYHYWRKYAFVMLVCSVGLLLLVFIPGLGGEWGTARSWINIFGFSLQPSEFVKLTFLLYLAAWMESRRESSGDFKQVTLPFLIVFGAIAFLLLLQPDLGTLVIIGTISLLVYFVGGGSVKHISIMVVVGVLGLVAIVGLKGYQIDRFRCFWDESYSPGGQCYQINQALIAVGSGGFWGRGLGHSRQKYMYLPEVNADAIFPIISEETGFLLSSGLILLYLLFFYRSYQIAIHSPDYYGLLLAIGVSGWISLQAMINIGGMINAIPMTGVTLPFVSSGGTSMIAAMSAVGLLANISKQGKK